MRVHWIILTAYMLTVLASCGGNSNTFESGLSLQAEPLSQQPQQVATGSSFPAGLPHDAVQPWERAGSGISSDSELLAGVENHLNSPVGTTEMGESLILSSLPASPAWAIYRFPTSGGDPGLLSVDANILLDAAGIELSDYYIAFADYSSGRWQWQGPFSDSHVRLSLPDSGLRSGADSFFAAVLTDAGSMVDVIGLGLAMRSPADTDAPPVPSGLTATPVASGAELQ